MRITTSWPSMLRPKVVVSRCPALPTSAQDRKCGPPAPPSQRPPPPSAASPSSTSTLGSTSAYLETIN
eukprot:71694-Prorocentrum_minimum.AAC.3